MKIILGIIAFIVLALSIRFILLGKKSQEMTVSRGLNQSGFLKACESKSNCVETGDFDLPSHLTTLSSLEPLKEAALKSDLILESEKEGGRYLHFTAKSKTFGFVDDIEFLLIDSKLFFRSSSRVGKSDLGANRSRLQELFKKTSSQ